MGLWVKDLVLSFVLGLSRCCGTVLIPGLGTSTCLRDEQKKKKKRKQSEHIYSLVCPGAPATQSVHSRVSS